MEKYLELLKSLGEIVPYALFYLVLGATFIVRLTPSPKDDEAVNKIHSFLLKVFKWLPTIGVNPQTKKLEEEVERLKQPKQ